MTTAKNNSVSSVSRSSKPVKFSTEKLNVNGKESYLINLSSDTDAIKINIPFKSSSDEKVKIIFTDTIYDLNGLLLKKIIYYSNGKSETMTYN